MWSSLLQLLGGGILLYFGAEWLVGGSSRLALALRIPKLAVGLTIVAYGTSAPEVVVSVEAAAAGQGAVALGNVVGSNIANLGLILGIATLVRPAVVAGELRKRELPVLAATTLGLVAILLDGVVSWVEAVALVGGAIVYTVVALRGAPASDALAEAEAAAVGTAEAVEAAGAPHAESRWKLAMIAGVGLVVLLVGGQLFVGGATDLARTLGMSERVVGLTIVAVGTSLPELVTSLIAAFRGNSDIAVGNVVGSNIFNVLGCLGLAGFAGAMHVDPRAIVFDLGVLGAVTALALVFLRTARTVRRWEGGLLLGAYVAFLIALV
ncbi:MAG: calcium/sodium antiporter [Polyangiaceae bacterium]|nr:calcium/sodium antiporter [Polyangiaceae bacterium]